MRKTSPTSRRSSRIRSGLRTGVAALGLSAVLLAAAAVEASETLSYSYDARGRLVQVSHSGGPSTGLATSYTFDKADNRTAKTTATGGGGTPCSGVSFTIASNGAITEGATSVFTITKSGTASGSCSVNYATANNTAAAPGDYTAKSGTLTFLTTDTSKTVSVTTINDTTVESAETFKMNLSSPTGGAALGTPNSATATINDNDSAGGSVSFAINDVSVLEDDTLVFTITKSGTTSSSFSVNYATADGTAVAPADYGAASGTLTFSPSATSMTVFITTNSDNKTGEADETMVINLSGASAGSTISDTQGVGTIINDTCPDPTTC